MHTLFGEAGSANWLCDTMKSFTASHSMSLDVYDDTLSGSACHLLAARLKQ